MRRLRLTACVTAGILAWCAGGRAVAQGYIPPSPGGISPITQPVYSPYLNLLRPGGNLTQNYFGLVRPEFDLRNAAGSLQNQAYQTDQSLNGLAYGANRGYAPLVTGHVATFLNTQGHFMNLRGSGNSASVQAFGPIYGGGGAAGAGSFGSGGRSFGSGFGGQGYGGQGYGGLGAGGFGGLGTSGGLRPGSPSLGGVGGSGLGGSGPIQ
jgi:hypothetical protein